MKDINCLQCGNDFHQVQNSQKFCSEKCRRKYNDSVYYLRRLENTNSNKICKICGKQYNKTAHNSCYCSQECYVKAQSMRKKYTRKKRGKTSLSISWDEVEKKIHKCTICGKDYLKYKESIVKCPECSGIYTPNRILPNFI